MTSPLLTGTIVFPPEEPPVVNVQPVPRWLPGPQCRTGNDFEVNDPRYAPNNEPYTSRTTGTGHTLPQAHKLEGGLPKKMDYKWSKFWSDCHSLYVPRAWLTMPPDWNDGVDWTWLGNFKSLVPTEQRKWFLHGIHGARAITNHMGPNDFGYYDPYTCYGTSYEDGRPPDNFYKKEPVTFGNNICNVSEGRKIWALDGFLDPPEVELVRDRFDILHIFTQSSPNLYDATKRPPKCPNGIWYVPTAPQAGENIFVHPIISCWENGKTCTKEGLNLREIQIPVNRYLPMPAPEFVAWPFIPLRPLIISP
jgi:hypothetical protein